MSITVMLPVGVNNSRLATGLATNTCSILILKVGGKKATKVSGLYVMLLLIYTGLGQDQV